MCWLIKVNMPGLLGTIRAPTGKNSIATNWILVEYPWSYRYREIWTHSVVRLRLLWIKVQPLHRGGWARTSTNWIYRTAAFKVPWGRRKCSPTLVHFESRDKDKKDNVVFVFATSSSLLSGIYSTHFRWHFIVKRSSFHRLPGKRSPDTWHIYSLCLS